MKQHIKLLKKHSNNNSLQNQMYIISIMKNINYNNNKVIS